MKKRISFMEQQFNELSEKGVTYKQDFDQYDMITKIMVQGYREKRKIWWFAYELIGFHKIKGRQYYMSYKAGTRLSEMAHDGLVQSRRTKGKLNLYCLIDF